MNKRIGILLFMSVYAGMGLFSRVSAHAIIDLNLAAAASETEVGGAVTDENVPVVEVGHKARGTLFALVPMTFTATALAYPDGTVELDYPWYSVLTVDSRDKTLSELTVAVDNALHTSLVGSVQAAGPSTKSTFTPSEAARVKRAMTKVLEDEWG